jgi:CTP synthase
MKDELPGDDTFFVHLTLLPHLSTSDEIKTKPTQHSVKELRGIGIQPDAIVARTELPLPSSVKQKIALFCDVPRDNVIEDPDLPTSYHAPITLHENGLTRCIVRGLGLEEREPDLSEWARRVGIMTSASERVRVGVVGKYVELKDSYISIRESLAHAGIAEDTDVAVEWISSEAITEKGAADLLCNVDGLLVPGGFGDRGIEGKIQAVGYARERGIPCFGLCLGMQCMAIDFARGVLGLSEANSSEFDRDTPDPVIALLEQQERVVQKGGTMRLGAYEATLRSGTISRKSYAEECIVERHRHRYEFNPAYRERFERAGMKIAGTSPDGKLVEILELPGHPWYVGVQFHPEFTSRFLVPHPLFRSFVRACQNRRSSSSHSES